MFREHCCDNPIAALLHRRLLGVFRTLPCDTYITIQSTCHTRCLCQRKHIMCNEAFFARQRCFESIVVITLSLHYYTVVFWVYFARCHAIPSSTPNPSVIPGVCVNANTSYHIMCKSAFFARQRCSESIVVITLSLHYYTDVFWVYFARCHAIHT